MQPLLVPAPYAESSAQASRRGNSTLIDALPRPPGPEAPSSRTALPDGSPSRKASLRTGFLKGAQQAVRQRQARLLAETDKIPDEQIRRQARAEVQLTGMARLAALQVDIQRTQRAEYVAQLRERIDTDDFKHPEALQGAVQRGADGLLQSPDKAINAVLQFVQAKYPQEAARLTLSPDTELRLPLEADILLNAWEFAAGCKVRELHLAGGESTTEDANIDLSTYAAREAIKKGAKAFGENAKFRTITSHDLKDGAEPPGEPALRAPHGAQAPQRPPVPLLGPNPQTAPFAFLQGVRYQADSNDMGLKDLVSRALSDQDAVTLELRGRMGAQAINAVLTQKHFSPALGWSMAASLIGSGGVAFALDVFAWSLVRSAVAKQFGEDHPMTNMTEVLLSSLTAAVAETADSCVIKRLLGTFRGEPLLPQSLAEALSDLKQSAIAGSIAAIGAIPNNAAALTHRWSTMPVSAITNQIALSTSGAMVPLEVAAGHEEMAAGALERMNEGFFPAPALALEPGASDAQLRRALAEHAKEDTRAALEVAPSHGLAINSMGIGSVISLATFLPFDILSRAKLLSPVVQKIVTIMVNTPTEVLSLGTGILSGKYLGGLGGALTTDAEKNRLVVELIANKAVERLLQAQAGEAPSIEITEKELRAIEHPSMALTFPAGRAIVGAMNGVADMLARTWGALRGSPPQDLAEKVDIDALLPQLPAHRPA